MDSSASPQSAFSTRSLQDPETFWAEQAGSIDWHRPFAGVCDLFRPPFARWFSGGHTNRATTPSRKAAIRATSPPWKTPLPSITSARPTLL